MVKYVIIALFALLLAGCTEQFAAGVGTGLVTAQKLSDDAQDRFIKVVNELNTQTERLNTEIEVVKNISVDDFVRPETIEAFEGLKGKSTSDWVTLAAVLGAAFFGGKIHEKKKK